MKCDSSGVLPLDPVIASTLDAFITKIRTDADDSNSQSGRSWITDDDASTHSGHTMTKRIYWPDGTLFEGFLNLSGRPDGRGELKAANGDRYVGDWRDGLLHGTGKYELGHGGVYEGQILGNQRHGNGRLICGDGRTYEGQWKDDKPHGIGRFTHAADGVSYYGEWMGGCAHGRGTYESRAWGRYVGQWVRGSKDGMGRVEYTDGNCYEGYWLNDMAHGRGRYQWANGDVYDGDFAQDKIEGEGRMFAVESGCLLTGLWRGNKKNGPGQIQFADGAVFKGEWCDDVPSGPGTFYNPHGIMFRGVWNNGMYQSEEYPRGLPVILVEGSSYQLQEDLRAQSGPHALIDSRVVVPVPPVGDVLAPSKVPRPRRFDESDSLADYLIEESSQFTSPVQPMGNQTAHKAGYVYHSRFSIEYWPHTGQRGTDEANMPTHRQREAVETYRGRNIHTDQPVEIISSACCQNLKTQPEFTIPEFADIGQAAHAPPTTIPEYSQPVQSPDVHRNIPVPVEACLTQELIFPKVRVNKITVDYPVFAPRIVEVPVMVETLNEEGLQVCREIEQQVAHLEGTMADAKTMSGCELEQLATKLGANADRLERCVQPPEYIIETLYNSPPFETVP